MTYLKLFSFKGELSFSDYLKQGGIPFVLMWGTSCLPNLLSFENYQTFIVAIPFYYLLLASSAKYSLNSGVWDLYPIVAFIPVFFFLELISGFFAKRNNATLHNAFGILLIVIGFFGIALFF